MNKKLRMKSVPAVIGLGLAALLATSAAHADAVNAVSYGSFSGSLVTFENLVQTDPDGSLLEGLQASGGVQFGERFAGQELAVTKVLRAGVTPPAQDWFDNLSFGSPNAGLTLLAGATGQNLGVYNYGDANGQALVGIGPKAGIASENWGFGSISARFATGQSSIGFQVRDSDGGPAFLSLYRADGSLIQTVTIASLSDSFYAFARDGSAADIAGFSLYNQDTYYGIAIDNLKYSDAVAAVPEPGSVALMLAGLLTMGALVRRRLS